MESGVEWSGVESYDGMLRTGKLVTIIIIIIIITP